MRKLQEIIDLVRDGGKPSYDELRYSLCVIDGLMALDGRSILRLAEDSNGARGKGISNIAMIIQRERFDRVKIALNSNPKEYLGMLFIRMPPHTPYRRFQSRPGRHRSESM